MKLYEEFKEYETLWEDYKPVNITLNKETFDVATKDGFKTYIEKTSARDAERQFPKGTKNGEDVKLKTAYAASRKPLNAVKLLKELKKLADNNKIDSVVIPELEQITKDFEAEYTSKDYDFYRNHIKVSFSKN
jgi:hypothetical protein